MSTCGRKRAAPLPEVFEAFVDQMRQDEAELWARGVPSTDAHEDALSALAAELLPRGDALLITVDV